MRHHHSIEAMLLYYPQDTTEDLGPTVLLPGTSYWEDGPKPPAEGIAAATAEERDSIFTCAYERLGWPTETAPHKVIVKKGTVALVTALLQVSACRLTHQRHHLSRMFWRRRFILTFITVVAGASKVPMTRAGNDSCISSGCHEPRILPHRLGTTRRSQMMIVPQNSVEKLPGGLARSGRTRGTGCEEYLRVVVPLHHRCSWRSRSSCLV
eukprot:COSAG02_NODE_8669_length_2486_cov_1.986594_2_plen_210_part_00